jgi:hypothetical protein
MPSRLRLVAPPLAVTGLALLAAACSDTSGLLNASYANTIDTVSLYALFGTPISTPSAYDLTRRAFGQPLVRTDQSAAFDFAFNFDSLGRAALYPTGAIQLGTASALQRSTSAFDSIKVAPSVGWRFDSAVVVDTARVVLVRSRATTCITGLAVSLYAKLQVLVIDTTARRIDFRILVDSNCGYRGLQPGIPKQ